MTKALRRPIRSLWRPGGVLLTLGAGLLLAACGGTVGSTSGGSGSSPSSAPALIHTQSISVGGTTETVLKTTSGLTLYYFTADTSSAVACTGSCAGVWPPLTATSSNPTSSPALPGHLTVLAGTNGMQVEYNGHPLYTYSKDQDTSDAYGQGLFGKWFVATPSLAMTPGASASASASATKSYNPY